MHITAINDEALWPAVVRRERAANSQFFYSDQKQGQAMFCGDSCQLSDLAGFLLNSGSCPYQACMSRSPCGSLLRPVIPLPQCCRAL
jgi:hypothetical protein